MNLERHHILPARIEPEGNDVLGLERHNNIHGEAAVRIFNGFSYISELILKNDKSKRGELIGNSESIEFPVVSIDDFRSLGLKRTQDTETGRVCFELYRTDIGSEHGGFFAIQNSDGSVILKRDLLNEQLIDKKDDDYGEIVSTAMFAMIKYGELNNISSSLIKTNYKEEHLSDKKMLELTKQAKKEQKLVHKSIDKIGKTVCKLGNTVRLVFTKETSNGLERKIAPGRIAVAALLLPIPGLSSGFFESPVPRPASLEIIADSATAIAANMNKPPAPDEEAIYDDKQIDITGAEKLQPGSGEQPIQYLSKVNQEASDFTIINDELYGQSPRRVDMAEGLQPGLCNRLGIYSGVQDKGYTLVTTNSKMQDKLTVEPNQDSVYVCNVSDGYIESGEASLVFDSL
jgi:hypothetical protein